MTDQANHPSVCPHPLNLSLSNPSSLKSLGFFSPVGAGTKRTDLCPHSSDKGKHCEAVTFEETSQTTTHLYQKQQSNSNAELVADPPEW